MNLKYCNVRIWQLLVRTNWKLLIYKHAVYRFSTMIQNFQSIASRIGLLAILVQKSGSTLEYKPQMFLSSRDTILILSETTNVYNEGADKHQEENALFLLFAQADMYCYFTLNIE